MIVNYNSSVINKFGASIIDDARVVIYNHHMFIIQATGLSLDYFFLPKYEFPYKTFFPSLMFAGKAWPYPKVEHLKGGKVLHSGKYWPYPQTLD
jgi:hypothetical protein